MSVFLDLNGNPRISKHSLGLVAMDPHPHRRKKPHKPHNMCSPQLQVQPTLVRLPQGARKRTLAAEVIRRLHHPPLLQFQVDSQFQN